MRGCEGARVRRCERTTVEINAHRRFVPEVHEQRSGWFRVCWLGIRKTTPEVPQRERALVIRRVRRVPVQLDIQVFLLAG